MNGNGFGHGKTIKCFKAFFTSMATEFDSSEWKFNPSTCTVIIDEYLP